MVAKKCEIELKAAIGFDAQDPLELGEQGWLAIRRKPHYFVLIAILRKSKILSYGLIEEPKRVGKEDATLYVQSGAVTHAPSSRGKVSEAVHRDRGGLAEWRDMKCGGKVCDMVLDLMNLSLESFSRESLLEQISSVEAGFSVSQPIEHEPEGRALSCEISRLPHEVR